MHVEVRTIVCGALVVHGKQVGEHLEMLVPSLVWMRRCAVHGMFSARKTTTAHLAHERISLVNCGAYWSAISAIGVTAQFHTRKQ